MTRAKTSLKIYKVLFTVIVMASLLGCRATLIRGRLPAGTGSSSTDTTSSSGGGGGGGGPTATLTITSPAYNGTQIAYSTMNAVTIAGTCSDSALPVRLRLYVDGVLQDTQNSITCTGGNTWTTNYDFTTYNNGIILISATQYDTSGDSTAATLTAIKDTAFCSVPANRALALSATGNGTPENPYRICTTTQFNAVSTLENFGIYFELGDDLDYANGAFTQWTQFRGNLNGRNHLVSRFVVTTGGGTQNGMIGNLYNGVIKNLHLISVAANSTTANYNTSGILAALMTENVTLDNVSTSGTLANTAGSCDEDWGGIVGRFDTGGHARILNSSSSATLSLVHGFNCVGGGILGSQYFGTLVMDNSSTTGTLGLTSGGGGMGRGNIGGLVGFVREGLAKIQNSYSTSNNSSRGSAGLVSLVAYTSHLSLENSHYSGAIGDHTNCTAISAGVGEIALGGSLSMKKVYGSGTITSTMGCMIGGLLGGSYDHYHLFIDRSFYTGSTSTPATLFDYSGGLIGSIAQQTNEKRVTIMDSFSRATVSNSNAAGQTAGIIGNLGSQPRINMQRVYSASTLTGAATPYGMVGIDNGGATFNVANSYYDQTLANTTTSTAGTNRTTVQMQTQATFVNFDFTNFWSMLSSLSLYPSLKWYSDAVGTDTTAPSAPTFTVPHRDSFKISYSGQSAVLLEGSCDDSNTNVDMTFTDGGTTESYAVPCLKSKTWRHVKNFSSYADGTITMTATQSDSAGNASTTTTRTMEKSTAYCGIAGNRTALLSATGTGAIGSPYRICTTTHWAAISGLENTGVYFQVDDDLDWDHAAVAKLATFRGVLNGQNYHLKDASVTTTNTNDGLIADLTGTVSDLHIQDIVVNASDGATRTGALAGRCSTACAVSNVSVTGYISGDTTGLGGLIGNVVATSSLQNIWVNAYIYGVSPGAAAPVGGIIGTGDDVAISGSSFHGVIRINSSGAITGGIAGTYTGAMTNSYNAGNIFNAATGEIGGLIGRPASTTAVTITDSYNTGDVWGAGSNVGGIVGNIQTNSMSVTLTRVYNSGNIGVEDQATGGLVGATSNNITLSIVQSYNSGDIMAHGGYNGTGSRAGGLIGDNVTSGSTTISNSYNIGNVMADLNRVGGLIGCSQNVTVTNSFSAATIAGTNTNVGGLIGCANGGNNNTLNNSFWDGDLTHVQTTISSGTVQTIDQMRTQTTFSGAGWDFGTIWEMSTTTLYPQLQWQ